MRFNDATYFNTWLPNSPQHQAALDTEYRITPALMIGVGADLQSRAYIDPTNTIWIGGYTLIDARVSYRTRLVGMAAEFLLSGRNLSGKKYIAFTEPDPDGNSTVTRINPAPTGSSTRACSSNSSLKEDLDLMVSRGNM